MTEFVDPYTDPESGFLRNRLRITDPNILTAVEADLSEARRLQLEERPVAVTADLPHLRAVHRHLFQDVYAWAGQVRVVDIRKARDIRAEFFMPAVLIESGAASCFGQLRAEGCLRGLRREGFVERLAHHYDQVNYLHPFREGNGRAQRVFWGQIALAAGFVLDWRQVTGEVNDRASRDAMEGRDFRGLLAMFGALISGDG